MPTDKFCVNCKHYSGAGYDVDDMRQLCTRVKRVDPVNGAKFYDACAIERTAMYGSCGPAGLHFVQFIPSNQMELNLNEAIQ